MEKKRLCFLMRDCLMFPLTSGKVLYKEVMLEECFACMHSQRMKSEFAEWSENHKNECHSKFPGSSGILDSKGCVRILKRSGKHGLQYVEFPGDEDSNSHLRLEEEKVFGDIKVAKLECICHVQKE